MMENIKGTLFTLHGLVASLIHVLIVVGFLSSFIYIQVAWYGEDMMIPSYDAPMKKK